MFQLLFSIPRWLRKLRLDEIQSLSVSLADVEGQKQHLNQGLPHPIYETTILVLGSILLFLFVVCLGFWVCVSSHNDCTISS